MIDRKIISIQLRHQNSRYGVKRGWNLAYLSNTVWAAQFKYGEEWNSRNVKSF